MKPGPGDLERRLAGEIRWRDDVVGDVARLAAELLGERQGAVGLCVGTIARAHDRVDRAVAAGDRRERRCQQVGDDDERISHEESIVLVTQSFDMPDSPALALPQKVGRYPPWHPALVAQGIEHRFPEPCVAGSNPAEGALVGIRAGVVTS